MGGLQREGEGKESGAPPPPKKKKKKKITENRVSKHTSPVPLKSQSYQVSIPCWVINQRNGNLMVFRWQANDGPLLWCLDPLSHHQLKKRCLSWTPPPPGKTFWLGNRVLCAKPKPPRANNNSGGFDLRHHAVLETLSAADNNS